MTDIRWKQRFNSYVKSLVEFEALVQAQQKHELSVIERTALIKFFEISNQLAIAMLSSYLKEQGIGKNFPKEVIREAFKRNLLADGQVWIDILVARNKAAHIYDEKVAQALSHEIPSRFFPAFKQLAKDFAKHYQQDD